MTYRETDTDLLKAKVSPLHRELSPVYGMLRTLEYAANCGLFLGAPKSVEMVTSPTLQ